jgi:hypothetical protein
VRGHRDLRIAVAAAAGCALLALVLPVDVLRLAFAIPLTLFLPGYAIVAATFARRPIDGTRRLLLGVGLSLAVLALGGLLLNYAGGLRSGTWALLLVAVVAAAARAAALRRPAASAAALSLPLPRIGAPAAGFLVAAALVTVAAFVLAFTPVSAKHAIGYTELWAQPVDGLPTPTARIGIGSDEQEATDYFLRVHFGPNGRTTIRVFKLKPGESRVIRFEDEASATNHAIPVHAALFRAEEPYRAYRRVSAWIAPPSTG